MIRLINKLRIYLYINFKKNRVNYILLILETSLTVCFVSLFITLIYGQFIYRINYLKISDRTQYLVLSLNSITSNNFYWNNASSKINIYDKLKAEIENYEGVKAVGSADIKHKKFGSDDCIVIQYDTTFKNIIHLTDNNNWLDNSDNACVIGGKIKNKYSIKDTLSYNGAVYNIVDYLSEPCYYIDTRISGNLNYNNILMESDNIIMLINNRKNTGEYGFLVIEIDELSFNEDIFNELYGKYGTTYTFSQLKKDTLTLIKNIILNDIPIITLLLIICILISSSSLLITSYSCKKEYSILLFSGENKQGLLLWNLVITSILLLLSWNMGIILSMFLCKRFTYTSNIVPESKVISLIICTIFLSINTLINKTLLKKNSFEIYSDNV